MSSSASRDKGKGGIEGDRKRTTQAIKVSAVIQDEQEKLMKLEKRLLEGIPNEVTLERIFTKLPWSNFGTLQCVSRAWQQAIRDRLVHDVRVRNHATQTVVIFNHIQSNLSVQSQSDRTNAISFYFWKDKHFYHLPPIPQVGFGIPWNCQCISLDGKIYVLGVTRDNTHELGSQEVYMLDLFGQGKWKQCARMKEGRQEFGCGVLDGKIYAFGGTSLGKPLRGSEVYDPIKDAWSPLSSKRDVRFNQDVTPQGEELYVYCGAWLTRGGSRTNSHGLKAYHPGQNKWRVLSRNLLKGHRVDGLFFMAQGKVHSMSLSQIYVYDIQNHSRTELHLFSLRAVEQQLSRTSLGPFVTISAVHAVLHVEDELLAILSLYRIGNGPQGRFSSYLLVHILVQSKGFSTEDKQIMWEVVPCPLSFVIKPNHPVRGLLHSPFMGLLQL